LEGEIEEKFNRKLSKLMPEEVKDGLIVEGKVKCSESDVGAGEGGVRGVVERNFLDEEGQVEDIKEDIMTLRIAASSD